MVNPFASSVLRFATDDQLRQYIEQIQFCTEQQVSDYGFVQGQAELAAILRQYMSANPSEELVVNNSNSPIFTKSMSQLYEGGSSNNNTSSMAREHSNSSPEDESNQINNNTTFMPTEPNQLQSQPQPQPQPSLTTSFRLSESVSPNFVPATPVELLSRRFSQPVVLSGLQEQKPPLNPALTKSDLSVKKSSGGQRHLAIKRNSIVSKVEHPYSQRRYSISDLHHNQASTAGGSSAGARVARSSKDGDSGGAFSSVDASTTPPAKPPRRRSARDGRGSICANCFVDETPLWRKGPEGQTLCNKCGLYWSRHSQNRPTKLDRVKVRPHGGAPAAKIGGELTTPSPGGSSSSCSVPLTDEIFSPKSGGSWPAASPAGKEPFAIASLPSTPVLDATSIAQLEQHFNTSDTHDKRSHQSKTAADSTQMQQPSPRSRKTVEGSILAALEQKQYQQAFQKHQQEEQRIQQQQLFADINNSMHGGFEPTTTPTTSTPTSATITDNPFIDLNILGGTLGGTNQAAQQQSGFLLMQEDINNLGLSPMTPEGDNLRAIFDNLFRPTPTEDLRQYQQQQQDMKLEQQLFEPVLLYTGGFAAATGSSTGYGNQPTMGYPAGTGVASSSNAPLPVPNTEQQQPCWPSLPQNNLGGCDIGVDQFVQMFLQSGQVPSTQQQQQQQQQNQSVMQFDQQQYCQTAAADLGMPSSYRSSSVGVRQQQQQQRTLSPPSQSSYPIMAKNLFPRPPRMQRSPTTTPTTTATTTGLDPHRPLRQ